MAHNIRKRAADSGPPLAIVWRRIEALRPDPANPRSHSPKQIRQLARSIGTFGFNVPILVDRTLRIVAGHGRLLAAQDLGWREVPTILLDHLSETMARAGEWWLLGKHRVGCGNLADAVDAMLVGEESAVVVVLAANPGSVDAIIRRWQALTGDTARQMASGRGVAEPTANASEAPDGG